MLVFINCLGMCKVLDFPLQQTMLCNSVSVLRSDSISFSVASQNSAEEPIAEPPGYRKEKIFRNHMPTPQCS